MKTFRKMVAVLALAIGVVPCAARATGDETVRQTVQSRYDQFDRAYMKKDFARVADAFSPDCSLRLHGEGRSMKAARVLKGMEALSHSLTVTHVRTRIVAFKAAGGRCEVKAVWTGESVYTPVTASKEDPARRSKEKQIFVDTWTKTDKGWKITNRTIEDSDDEKHPNKKK